MERELFLDYNALYSEIIKTNKLIMREKTRRQSVNWNECSLLFLYIPERSWIPSKVLCISQYVYSKTMEVEYEVHN